MKFSRVRFIFLIILLSAAALWFTDPERLKETQSPLGTSEHKSYSWQAINTTIWTITPNTPEKQTLVKANIIEYQDEGQISQFTKPEAFQIEDGIVTKLKSEKARGIKDEDIEFTEKVTLTQKRPDSETLTQLKTDTLHYNVSQQKAHTDSNVQVEFEAGSTHGQGLEADLKNQTLKIHKNVSSVLIPSE